MTKVLVDMGGTYARFAVEQNGQIAGFKKYNIKQTGQSFDALAQSFCQDSGITDPEYLIATAANPKDTEGKEIWYFANTEHPWQIDFKALQKSGMKISKLMNDFEAATWGIIAESKAFKSLNKLVGKGSNDKKIVTGPGTGLGLAYFKEVSDKHHEVDSTMGGQMPAAAPTEYQRKIYNQISYEKHDGQGLTFEDLVKGQGLRDIYDAVCAVDKAPNMYEAEFETAEVLKGILQNKQDPAGQKSIKLFHEFFGLFAQTAATTAHAYGGIYLTGGVIDRLEEAGCFDLEAFEKFLRAHKSDVMKQMLKAIPIYHVSENDTLALKGLAQYAHESLSHD